MEGRARSDGDNFLNASQIIATKAYGQRHGSSTAGSDIVKSLHGISRAGSQSADGLHHRAAVLQEGHLIAVRNQPVVEKRLGCIVDPAAASPCRDRTIARARTDWAGLKAWIDDIGRRPVDDDRSVHSIMATVVDDFENRRPATDAFDGRGQGGLWQPLVENEGDYACGIGIDESGHRVIGEPDFDGGCACFQPAGGDGHGRERL